MSMDKTTAYSVVELTQECNKEKVISDNHLFSTRENALAYMYKRYLDIRREMEDSCGVFNHFWSDDGYFECVNKDGDSYECDISECLAVDAAVTPEIIAAWNKRNAD